MRHKRLCEVGYCNEIALHRRHVQDCSSWERSTVESMELAWGSHLLNCVAIQYSSGTSRVKYDHQYSTVAINSSIIDSGLLTVNDVVLIYNSSAVQYSSVTQLKIL